MRARINKRTNISRETFGVEQEKVFQHGRIRDWGASGEAASLREARSRPGGAVAGGVGAKRHPCQFRAAFRVACVGLSGKGSAYAQVAKSLTRCKSSFPKATLSWVLLCVHASTRSHVHAPVFLHAHAPSRTRPHSHAPARPHARAPTCPHPLPHSHARSRSSRGGASPPPPASTSAGLVRALAGFPTSARRSADRSVSVCCGRMLVRATATILERITQR